MAFSFAVGTAQTHKIQRKILRKKASLAKKKREEEKHEQTERQLTLGHAQRMTIIKCFLMKNAESN